MSSEPQRGRSPTPARVLETAVRVGKRARERVKDDTLESCLANEERQEAIERLLLRFGEALKALPAGFLAQIDASIEWNKPIRFRELASHWYEYEIDHQLIWNVLPYDLQRLIVVLESHLNSLGGDQTPCQRCVSQHHPAGRPRQPPLPPTAPRARADACGPRARSAPSVHLHH